MPTALWNPRKESSNIACVGFEDPHGQDLLQANAEGQAEVMQHATQGTFVVMFKNGTRYHYQGVPAEVVKDLLEADSIGKAFNANIKGNEAYHGQKVDPVTGEPLQPTEETRP